MTVRPYSQLRKSQLAAIERARTEPCLMLGMGMGLGKTAAALTIALEKLNGFYVRHVLVVAPLLVAEEVWPEEIAAWEHTQFLSYAVLTGTPKQREKAAKTLPEISIINGENIPWLVDFWGDDWPYDMLIIDEISRFKAPKKRTKPTAKAIEKVVEATKAKFPRATPEMLEIYTKNALKRLSGNVTRFGALAMVRENINYVVGLTGTMAPQGLLDLWSQYFLVDAGKRLGTSYYNYRRTYFESDYMGFNWTPKESAFEKITSAVKDITISMRTEDYVDLPEVIYNEIRVKLPPKALKQYEKMQADLLLETEEHDIVEALNNGVLTNKLLQIANGALYVERDGVQEFVELHDAKFAALDRVITEAAGAPVLVAYSFDSDLVRLKKRYPNAEVVGEAPDLQKRWNAGEIPLLLAHPAACGHGLNLQYGGCVMVWFGLNWSLELYQQMNKRLHRPGQTETVVIHHILAADTVDERVMRVLPLKAATQDAITEATLYKEDEHAELA